MSNLKNQLIKLGSENPDLRGHIFKIIDYMKLANSKENLVRKLVKDSREAAEFIDLFGMRIPNRGSRKENKFNQIIEKYLGEEYFLKGSFKKQVAKLSKPKLEDLLTEVVGLDRIEFSKSIYVQINGGR